jgi:hypothetical protein
MRSEVLARLDQIARGEIVSQSGVTRVTGVTRPKCYTQKAASLHALPLLHPETGKGFTSHSFPVTAGVTAEPLDAFDLTERMAIAVVDSNVPLAYAHAWAAFQIRNPPQVSAAEWCRAVDDAGRFLDEWAGLALDFGWQPDDIFGPGRSCVVLRRQTDTGARAIQCNKNGRASIHANNSEFSWTAGRGLKIGSKSRPTCL